MQRAGSQPISGISSMATKAVLAELAMRLRGRARGTPVAIESVGGVDAAKRVQAGEPFDVVVLARDAIDKLLAAGHLVAGSEVDPRALGRRGRGAAPARRGPTSAARTRSGARCWRRARSGTSTGPSGVALGAAVRALGHRRRGCATGSSRRRPAFPWARWSRAAKWQLGFQQLSELIHVARHRRARARCRAPIQIVTTFSAAVGTRARQPDAARGAARVPGVAGRGRTRSGARAWSPRHDGRVTARPRSRSSAPARRACCSGSSWPRPASTP